MLCSDQVLFTYKQKFVRNVKLLHLGYKKKSHWIEVHFLNSVSCHQLNPYTHIIFDAYFSFYVEYSLQTLFLLHLHRINIHEVLMDKLFFYDYSLKCCHEPITLLAFVKPHSVISYSSSLTEFEV